MRRFILELSAREPLVLTDGSSESMAHRTLGYIPGRMLLGALAGAWLNQNRNLTGRPDDQPDFRALFLDGSVSWGHAYPWLNGRQALPAPQCWRKIKNTPDLPRAGNEDVAAEEVKLVNRLTWEGSREELQKNLNLPGPLKLKKLAADFLDPVTFRRPEHLEQWTMHVALDRSGRQAAEGLLFGFSALAPGARLAAEILARDEAAAKALEKLRVEIKSLRVGHARSAGYGLVQVERFEEASPGPLTEGEFKAGRQILFLLSDYLPRQSWLSLA
ncbi:MAG: hypothetical protein LBV21_05560, partial [Candidatus Adiutrix sp.]|nr:hypothetical protein [Candidatus Adiutrix sp.]